jgi:hypothetical protein
MRAQRKRWAKWEAYRNEMYVTDEKALARAYREYSLTGVLEDPLDRGPVLPQLREA